MKIFEVSFHGAAEGLEAALVVNEAGGKQKRMTGKEAEELIEKILKAKSGSKTVEKILGGLARATAK